MTVRHRDAFANHPAAGFDGTFNWDFLKLCWGGKIEPMDVDAVVERKGHILIFETKPRCDRIPRGQAWTLARFIDLGRGRITVVTVLGKCHQTVRAFSVWRFAKTARVAVWDAKEGSGATLCKFCDQWYINADVGKSGQVVPDAMLAHYLRRRPGLTNVFATGDMNPCPES